MKMAVSHDTTTTSKGDDRGLSSDPRNEAEGPGGNKLWLTVGDNSTDSVWKSIFDCAAWPLLAAQKASNQ